MNRKPRLISYNLFLFSQFLLDLRQIDRLMNVFTNWKIIHPVG